MESRGQIRGQATIEFVLMIPVVFVALLGVVQVAAIAYSQLAVTHAAREAVRVLAVEPGADVRLLEQRIGYSLEVTVVAGSAPSSRPIVHVVARERIDAITPIFGPFVDDLEVMATAKMVGE